MPDASRPRVTLHYAQTLDGRIATRTGHARWISSEETLRLAHRLRAEHDAVLVGVGTVIADDPQLTVRRVPGRSPLRVVLDSTLRLPLDSLVLADGAAPTLVVTTERAAEDRRRDVERAGSEVLVAEEEDGRVLLPSLLSVLEARGIRSLLVEGGAGIITSFLQQGLVDRFMVTVAPKIAGAGVEAVGDLGILDMGQALRLRNLQVSRQGGDLVLEGRLEPSDDEAALKRVAREEWSSSRSEMKAVWFPRARTVEIRPERLPPVGSDDVRVRALASGISSGTEMLVYRGQVPARTSLDLPTLRGSFAFPITYGYAAVGRIAEVGSAVTGRQVGDLVFVHHPHATEYVVPATMPVRLPSDLPPEIGVFYANLETAITIVLDAHPRLGERVVVFGQGVVGLLVTRLVKLTGAGTIIAIDPIERRRDLALQMGADIALEPGVGLPDVVREQTGGVGADIAIEASGTPAALAAALDCVAFGGTIVVGSWYGTKPAELPLGGAFHRGRLRLVSSQVGTIDPALAPRWDRERRSRLAVDLLTRLDLAPLITHRIPFLRAAEAYAMLDECPDEAVQVVLTYGEDDV